MAATAEITWVSKDEALVRTVQKAETGFDKMIRKLDQIESASKKAAKATETGFDAAGAKVAQFVTNVTGVGSVLAAATTVAQQLKAEWQAFKAEQGRAADVNLKLADVLPGTLRQFGGLLNAKDIQGAVEGISQRTGADSVRVAQAIGEAGAARGATNRAEAMQAVSAAEAALRYAPGEDAATIAALAGGTTDIQRRFNVSPEQAIGFLHRVGGQARVTSLREQTQNINPAIGGLVEYGMSPQAAGGLVTTLTGLSGDVTGATSRVASLQLAKQLQDRGFATPEAGIAALQADPRLRAAFFEGGRFGGKKYEKATFEAAQLPFIRALVTGGSAAAQIFSAATREAGTFEQGGQAYREFVTEMERFPSVQLAKRKRVLSQGVEELRSRNLIGAGGSIDRAALEEYLAASGMTDFGRRALMAEYEAVSSGGQSGSGQALVAQLRRRAGYLTAPTQAVSAGVGGGGVQVPRQVSRAERETADTLNRVAGLLEELVRESKNQTGEMRSGRTEPRATNPPSAGLDRRAIR